MDTGIRLARREDIPALCDIWQDCFHDPEAYIRSFYTENFAHILIPVFTINDQPVSMLHLLDADFAYGTEEQHAKLIYAAGTRPDYRESGFMGSLLQHVTAQAKLKNDALFLKPSSAYLTDYYKAFGFKPDACLRLVSLQPGKPLPFSFSTLPPEAYNRLRNAAFSGRPYVRWPDRHLRWCVKENELFGGRTLSVRQNARLHFLMGAPENGAFVITETDLSLSQLRQMSGALCERFGTEALQAYLPEHSCDEGEKMISSLVFNAPLRNAYVNLILI